MHSWAQKLRNEEDLPGRWRGRHPSKGSTRCPGKLRGMTQGRTGQRSEAQLILGDGGSTSLGFSDLEVTRQSQIVNGNRCWAEVWRGA